MSKFIINKDNIFLRLPRFNAEMYLNIVNKSLDEASFLLKRPPYAEFLELLKSENVLLYEAVREETLDLKKFISILNYLMRATTRCSPYLGFSGVAKLNLGDKSDFYLSQEIHVNSSPRECQKKLRKIVKNKLVKIVGDSIFFQTDDGFRRVVSSEVLAHFNKLSDSDIELNRMTISLLKMGLLKEIEDLSLFHSYQSSSEQRRSNLDYKLSNNIISEKELESIINVLDSLTFLDSSEINKSMQWIEAIRRSLFPIYGTNSIKLLDIFLGTNIFRESIDNLYYQAQSKITRQRDVFAQMLNVNTAGPLELTDDILSKFQSAHTDGHSNLSQRFGVIIKRLVKSNDYKAQLLYMRSSYNGLRANAEYASFDADLFEGSDKSVIFCDLVCQGEIEKNVLLKRPLSTRFAISLDGTRVHHLQTEILLDDLYIYTSSKEIVLFSKKLNKRIIPVMTTSFLAENAKNPFYRFLAALSKCHFNDGIHFDFKWLRRSVYPRITYKGLILFPKTWFLDFENVTEEFIGQLPEYVRVLSEDRDAFLCTKSPYFIEQLRKISKEELTIQEDFSFESSIKGENDVHFFNEIFFSYKRESLGTILNFRPYCSQLSNVEDEVQEIRICAPENFLTAVLDYLNLTYLKGVKFYFINYQYPSSHLRLRIINQKKVTTQILDDRILYEKFCVSNISQTPYEIELSTYSSIEGFQLYLDYSVKMSDKYFEMKKATESINLGIDANFGPLSDMVFLGFLASFILKNEALKVSFDEDYKMFSYKRIWQYIRANLKNNDSKIISLRDHAADLALELQSFFLEWNTLFSCGKVSKDTSFFKYRVLHMEIFRFTNGTYKDANDFILKFANDIQEREKYV